MWGRTGAKVAAFLVAVLAGSGATAASAVAPTAAAPGGPAAVAAAGSVGSVGQPVVGRGALPLVLPPDPAAEPVDVDTSVAEIPLVVPPADEAPVEPGLAAADLAADDAVEPESADEPVVAALAAPVDRRVVTDVIDAEGFQTLGVTWPGDADPADLAPAVRVLTDGEWSEWQEVPIEDTAPDPGTPDAAGAVRGGTESVWLGGAPEAVQLSFAATPEGGPDDLTLVLIGSEPVDPAPVDGLVGAPALGEAQVTQAAWGDTGIAALAPVPRVISRAEWGAAPQVCTPDVSSRGLVGAVLHHTAGSNAYANQAQAMQQIRNDQRYHIQGRGWCDIGYNFIVDKWGNIYEGRANSSTQPVIGVHAGGFNTATVGISMLGTYDGLPPVVTQESVARIVAWRLGQYHRDPAGWFTYHTLGGENSKYPAGVDVNLPALFAHRDVAYTACPGNGGYQVLPNIRGRARELIGSSFVNPTATPTTLSPDQTLTVRAATFGNINWRLEVRHAVSGTLLASSTGYAQQAYGGVVATWDGKGPDGKYVGVGSYRLTLTGTDTGGQAVHPWTTTVQALRDTSPPVVDPVPLTGNLRFVPVTPARLLDTRQAGVPVGPRSRLDLVVAGTAGVPADARAVALNVTAVDATAVTYLSVYPAGQPRPASSVLNSDRNRSAAAAGVLVGVGGERKVSIYNNAGTAHLVVDVTGYFTESGGDGYGALPTGARVLDTRTDGGRMASGQRRTVQVAGRNGVPADATAVVLNVVSAVAAGNGNLAVVPKGGSVTVSTVNHLPGQDVANRTVVPLSGGAVDVVNTGGATNVVIDVVGWFGPSGTARYTPIVPARAFDTRVAGGMIGAGRTATLPVRSSTGIPADAVAAAMTLTATQQTAPFTFLSMWPTGAARPLASDLNTGRGRDQANSTIVRLGPDGNVQVYNNMGLTHVVGDVYGWFR